MILYFFPFDLTEEVLPESMNQLNTEYYQFMSNTL